MSISTWAESIPSNTSAVGQFPSWAATIWRAIEAGLGLEHYWPGAGGSYASIGDLAAGGTRTFVDTQSRSSLPAQGIGRLFFASDVSRLFAYDSGGTYMVGTAFGSSASPSAGTGFWLRQTGSYSTTGNLIVQNVVFPIPYLQAPNIRQTRSDNTGGVYVLFVNSVANTNYSSEASAIGAASGVTVVWEALGLASSGSF